MALVPAQPPCERLDYRRPLSEHLKSLVLRPMKTQYPSRFYGGTSKVRDDMIRILYGGNYPLKVAFRVLSGVIATVNGIPNCHQAL